jgi:hypothetical protein
MLETKCKIQDVSSDSRGLDTVDMSKPQWAIREAQARQRAASRREAQARQRAGSRIDRPYSKNSGQSAAYIRLRLRRAMLFVAVSSRREESQKLVSFGLALLEPRQR